MVVRRSIFLLVTVLTLYAHAESEGKEAEPSVIPERNMAGGSYPGSPSYPGSASQPGYPNHPGNPGYPGYPGPPSPPGYPGPPSPPGYPVSPGHPGHPGYPGPSYPGSPAHPGYPGPSYPGSPAHPGYPGYPVFPVSPKYPGYPAFPGSLKDPHYYPFGPVIGNAVNIGHKPIDNVVEEAINKTDEEERFLKLRRDLNIDRPAKDFEKLNPRILFAANRTIGAIAQAIARPSRIINWIASIAGQKGLHYPLATFLGSAAAKRAGLACPFVPIECSASDVFSRVDGKCNNLQNSLWGSSFIPLRRVLAPHYDIGYDLEYPRFNQPRQLGIDRTPLPSARRVSNMVHDSSSTPIVSTTTTLFVHFGQFVTHDFSDTPMESGFEGATMDCCNVECPSSRCASIPIPTDDFFRTTANRDCLHMTRSVETTDINCNKGVRQQMNAASAYIDVTQIYGRNQEELDSLRIEEGLLLTSFGNQLPLQAHPNMKALERGANYLTSGDEKVGEAPALIGQVTIWQREHNRVARQLAQLDAYSQLPDETRGDVIFYNARRIVIATMQRIVYNEYLPPTIGPAAMEKHQLVPLTTGYFDGYDPNTNPGLYNVFVSAGFRFGHSMVRSFASVLTPQFTPMTQPLSLRKTFFRPTFYLLYENGLHRGLSTDKGEVCDKHMTKDMRNHLFETKNGNGNDLASLNIQRGRDHGLPSYSKFRKYYQMSEPVEWSTSSIYGLSAMTPATMEKFRSVYKDPRDIDVWSGGVSEERVAGGEVGPLFAEIIATQFKEIRKGDRFFYESPTAGFSAEQLTEIRKASMARIICDNVEGVDQIQPLPFLMPTNGGTNDRVYCTSLSYMDLSKFPPHGM